MNVKIFLWNLLVILIVYNFSEIYEILNSLPYMQELETGPTLREINAIIFQ
jgi:hypothetical protein